MAFFNVKEKLSPAQVLSREFYEIIRTGLLIIEHI